MLMFSALTMYSQTTDSVKIQEPVKYEYCEILSTSGLLSTKVKIEVDYGQEVSFSNKYEKRVVRDESGKQMKFNSIIDALNYMGNQGWEFVQSYALADDISNVYHFLMKRNLE